MVTAEGGDAYPNQEMVGDANAAFDGGVAAIPARQLAGIDLWEFAVEFEDFAQFFDGAVVFNRPLSVRIHRQANLVLLLQAKNSYPTPAQPSRDMSRETSPASAPFVVRFALWCTHNPSKGTVPPLA